MVKKEERVLVVEANPLVTHAIEQAGERLPFHCDRASDGWEAIEKLELEDYAAIVIDTDAPRHSGFGVLTYLREEVGEDLRNVIVVSDRDDVTQRLRGERLRVVRRDEAVDALSAFLTPEVEV